MQYVKKVTRVYLQNFVQGVKVPPPPPPPPEARWRGPRCRPPPEGGGATQE